MSIVTASLTLAGFPSIAVGQCAMATLTVIGLAVNDFVILKGPGNAGWQPNVVATGTNTITIRMCNHTLAAADPDGQQLTYMAQRQVP